MKTNTLRAFSFLTYASLVVAAGLQPAHANRSPAMERDWQAARARTEIASCQDITRPGTYVLTSDLHAAPAADCIRVLAPDVSIDLNGHDIEGAGTPKGAGINANAVAADDVAIRNGRITGFWIGAVLKSGTVERVSVYDVQNGLYVGTGAVLSNTVAAVHTGIQVHSARVEGNAIETDESAIVCNITCVATANVVNGAPATVAEAGTTESATSL
jgi:hypothetical protein